MKKVLVTGSSGFIAPHVIESCLKNNYEVIGIDLTDPEININNCTYLKKDIRDLKVKDLEGIDFIIHLAFVTNIPYSIKNPVVTSNDNIQMTVGLLDIATKAKCKKLIFRLLRLFMGIIPYHGLRICANPPEPYCWQKYACEMLCKMGQKIFF